MQKVTSFYIELLTLDSLDFMLCIKKTIMDQDERRRFCILLGLLWCLHMIVICKILVGNVHISSSSQCYIKTPLE